MAKAEASVDVQRLQLSRALMRGDASLLQLRFDAAVVDRYRGRAGVSLIRTRSVGRVAVAGRWSIDLGLVEGDGRSEVHLSFGDFRERLPEDERPHWLDHLVPQPLSANFLTMQSTPMACIDDGEPEPWA